MGEKLSRFVSVACCPTPPCLSHRVLSFPPLEYLLLPKPTQSFTAQAKDIPFIFPAGIGNCQHVSKSVCVCASVHARMREENLQRWCSCKGVSGLGGESGQKDCVGGVHPWWGEWRAVHAAIWAGMCSEAQAGAWE